MDLTSNAVPIKFYTWDTNTETGEVPSNYDKNSVSSILNVLKQSPTANAGNGFTSTTNSATNKFTYLDIPYRRYIDNVIHFVTGQQYAPIEF